ncbi:hypothetical protein D3C78_1185280 [compost metagenome]
MQARVLAHAVADHQIDAGVLVQVDQRVAGVQAQADLRVLGIEAAKARDQPEGGEGRRSGERQVAVAALRTQLVEGLGHFEQGAVEAAEQALATVGQAHAARQPLE